MYITHYAHDFGDYETKFNYLIDHKILLELYDWFDLYIYVWKILCVANFLLFSKANNMSWLTNLLLKWFNSDFLIWSILFGCHSNKYSHFSWAVFRWSPNKCQNMVTCKIKNQMGRHDELCLYIQRLFFLHNHVIFCIHTYVEIKNHFFLHYLTLKP